MTKVNYSAEILYFLKCIFILCTFILSIRVDVWRWDKREAEHTDHDLFHEEWSLNRPEQKTLWTTHAHTFPPIMHLCLGSFRFQPPIGKNCPGISTEQLHMISNGGKMSSSYECHLQQLLMEWKRGNQGCVNACVEREKEKERKRERARERVIEGHNVTF